jgi:hypothetical protein
MAELTEWLKIMLGEVTRKDEEHSRAAAEIRARAAESKLPPAEPAVPVPTEVR